MTRLPLSIPAIEARQKGMIFHIKLDIRQLFKNLRPLQFNYMSYELQSLEMSHFGIIKKVEKCDFFYYFYFF